MKESGRLLWMVVGMVLGGVAVFFGLANRTMVQASNDRFEDYILCTGPVAVAPGAPTDGVWMLDYKSGKLLGTVINRVQGKIISWAEVDLVSEFGIQPRQNVHFVMTTGTITNGQAALYIAETSTGKFGVYTMGTRPDGVPGLAVRRHDQTWFRQQKE